MEKPAISQFALLLATLSASLLAHVARWKLCTATAQTPKDQHHAYTGQKQPITYKTQDGTFVTLVTLVTLVSNA